jgi:hypothetical protein
MADRTLSWENLRLPAFAFNIGACSEKMNTVKF